MNPSQRKTSVRQPKLSVDHIYTPVTGTPFYQRKMRTFFCCLDSNCDGILTEEDFEAMADNLVKNRRAVRGSSLKEMEAHIRGILANMWHTFFSNPSGEKGLSEDAFVATMVTGINGKLRECLDSLVDSFFDIYDENRDKSISKTEMATNHKYLWKMSEAESAIIFDLMDTDMNGSVSKDEHRAAYMDFFASEDPRSPFKVICGHVKT